MIMNMLQVQVIVIPYYRHLFDLGNRPPHGFAHGIPRLQPPGFHREMMMGHEGILPPFDMGIISLFLSFYSNLQ